MKKIITFAIVLFVLMNHSFPVGASQTESVPPVSKEDTLYYREDYSEIKQLEAEIETDLSQSQEDFHYRKIAKHLSPSRSSNK